MDNLGKMETAAFVNLIMIIVGKNNETFLGKLRINPFHITSYYEQFDTRRDDKPVTVICVGGASFWVDMTIKEVDEMMDNIDRGMLIKE